MLETLQLFGKHDLEQTLVNPMENKLFSECGDLTINRTQRTSTAGQDRLGLVQHPSVRDQVFPFPPVSAPRFPGCRANAAGGGEV